MGQKFQCRFYYLCKPIKTNAGYEAEDIVLDVVDFPFMPQKGMVLCLTDMMDFSVVDEVFWMYDKPDRLDIHFEEPDLLRDFEDMAKDGWKVASHVS